MTPPETLAHGRHAPSGTLLLGTTVTAPHRGGRHIRYGEPTPLANLHLTMLDKVGVPLDAFADSTGKLRELYSPVTL